LIVINPFVLNYLAHAYLSFGQVDILVGNMISDFVKGKKKFDYPKGVQNGISLHRAIDEYTDRHPLTLQAKKFFRPAYGLYSGAFMDIVYDHFLANDRNEFPDNAALGIFSQKVYAELSPLIGSLPERFQQVFRYMQGQDWLYQYQFKEHIYSSFKGLALRAKFIREYQSACSVLDEHYMELRSFYAGFFPDLKHFAIDKLEELTAKPGQSK
jgi:acyl carrier protein phosphodiesterase